MSMPSISVIIPFYNVEKCIGECLESVLQQTLEGIEIICVNDGSNDRSREIVEEYVKKNNNIKLINKENGGQSSARNMALDVAKGDYIFFLDSDDYIDRKTLEITYQKAIENDLDIVFFNASAFFENEDLKVKHKNYINFYDRKSTYHGVYTGQTMFALMREKGEFYVSPCLEIFRRNMIIDNGLRFYEGIIHEDNLFTFQSVMLAKRVEYIDRSFYYRRIREESTVTREKCMKNVEGYIVSYTEVLSFLRQCEIEENAKPYIMDFLYYGLYKNAYNIYDSLDISDEEKKLTKGDFCAEHFFDVLKYQNIEQNYYKNEINNLKEQIEDIKCSNSFRVGKLLMFIPGKIKRLILDKKK